MVCLRYFCLVGASTAQNKCSTEVTDVGHCPLGFGPLEVLVAVVEPRISKLVMLRVTHLLGSGPARPSAGNLLGEAAPSSRSC